jgi:hypothetical protein
LNDCETCGARNINNNNNINISIALIPAGVHKRCLSASLNKNVLR